MIDKDKSIIWDGIEVEGRLRGLHTIFIGNKATVEDLRDLGIFSHIYFNEEVMFKEGVVDFIRQLTPSTLVSFSIYNHSRLAELPSDILQRCIINLVFESPAFELLKLTDMVKIEVGPFHNFQATKNVFSETEEWEYRGDVEWQQK